MILPLILFHYLADFGLQNDFIAKFKAPKSAPFWWHVMTGHCAIHALGVLVATGSHAMAVCEFVAHFSIDCLKCTGRLSFNQDQALHIVCKFVWFLLVSSIPILK